MMQYCNFNLKDEKTLKGSQALPEGFTVKYIGEPGAPTEKFTCVHHGLSAAVVLLNTSS